MNGKPDQVVIRVKEYGGTYIATCKEVKMRASCTSGAREAAHTCAYKIYGADKFHLAKIDNCTFDALAVSPELPIVVPASGRAWRKPADLPDDDISVLIRVESDEDPVTCGFHSDGAWCSFEIGVIDAPVTGWMHLHDAARILDAATLTSQPNGLNR